MAKLKQKDLEHLTNDEIREIICHWNQYKKHPKVVREFYESVIQDRGKFTHGAADRLYNLLTRIVMKRFQLDQI